MTRRLYLGIDPGLRACGWSLWTPGLLLDCGLAVGSTSRDPRGPPAWQSVTAKTVAAVEAAIPDAVLPKICCEWPQIYAVSKQKGDPDDLLELAGVVGSLSDAFVNAPFYVVRPRAWKGQVPKAIHHARLLQKLNSPSKARLDACLLPVPEGLQHNVLDAVALGLWSMEKNP